MRALSEISRNVFTKQEADSTMMFHSMSASHFWPKANVTVAWGAAPVITHIFRSREATSAHSCGRQPADHDGTDGAKPRSGGSRALIPVAASRLGNL
jgi:hypothetical protein